MTTTTGKFNVNFDFGHLLINDAQPFSTESITESQIKERGIQNLEVFFRELFNMCTSQVGEYNENRDFDKPKDTVKLPERILILPRSKPLPKPKPLTKWEKYRLEKGLPPRKKRSRMIWSELAQDWVPRWGKGR
jgi:regulator of ribosome biosynthesis